MASVRRKVIHNQWIKGRWEEDRERSDRNGQMLRMLMIFL